MKRLFAVVILVLHSMLWAAVAFAQSLPDGCGQNPAGYARYLQEKFGEKPLWSGVPEDRDGEVEEGVKLYEKLLLEMEKCYHDPERGKCECGKVAQEFVEAIQRQADRRSVRIIGNFATPNNSSFLEGIAARILHRTRTETRRRK